MYRILPYFRISLTILLAVACIIGDWLVELYSSSPIAKAIFDNATHACVGLLTAPLLFIQLERRVSSAEKNAVTIICGLVSSLIDVDHFIAARSLKLTVCMKRLDNRIIQLFCTLFLECHEFATTAVSPLHHNSTVDSGQLFDCPEISIQTMVRCDNLCLSLASQP